MHSHLNPLVALSKSADFCFAAAAAADLSSASVTATEVLLVTLCSASAVASVAATNSDFSSTTCFDASLQPWHFSLRCWICDAHFDE